MKKLIAILILCFAFSPQIFGQFENTKYELFLGNSNNPIGLSWNKTADTYARLGGATRKTQAYFNNFAPWNRMRRCNLSDAGVVNAYYGDAGYIEDGSNGQVMVEIPLFYYRTDITATGYSWYVSSNPFQGSSIHPAFYVNGVLKQKIYIGAFEATTYDVSASLYNTTDAAGVDFTATTGDKLSSIANVKPISGLLNSLTIINARILAHNRGTGWEQQDFNTVSAIQMLYLIEYGGFNSQNLLSAGVTNITEDGSTNMAIYTGYTGSKSGGTQLGNTSGQVAVTHYQTAQTTHAMSYRGIENLYGNIWKFVDGINIQNNVPYVSDNNFVSDKFTSPYASLGVTLSNTNGYPKDIATNANNYYFLALTIGGSTSTYLTDAYSQSTGNKVIILGGGWNNASNAGVFDFDLSNASSSVYRTVSTRLQFK